MIGIFMGKWIERARERLRRAKRIALEHYEEEEKGL
jgi:hypothetical protein